LNNAGLARRVLPRLVAVAVLVAAAVLIYRDRHSLREAVTTIGWGSAVLALVCGILGTLAVEQIWLAELRGLGVKVPGVAAARVFLVSQLGKYLPGSVWPVLSQMEFGRRRGIARSSMFAANVLMMTVVTTTGLLTSAALLPWSSSAGLKRYWWTLIFIPPLLALLHPRAIPALVDWLLRLLKREPLGTSVTTRGMVEAIGWGFATWLFLGLHLLIMVHALGGKGAAAFAASIGGMALAFAAGLIFIPAPAGAGVREAVIVATFNPIIGSSDALAVALASRVLLVVADVAVAAGGELLARLKPEPAPSVVAAGPAAQLDGADGVVRGDSSEV
jgi:uncharacterized membrane protein YbhN (UPF0104 family)